MMNNRNPRAAYPIGLAGNRNNYASMRGQQHRHGLERDLFGARAPLNRQGGGCGCEGGRGRDQTQRREVQSRVNQVRMDQAATERPCGCGCGGHHADESCEKLLKQLQTVDFALCEVILYLDAYPDDCEALHFYHKMLARRQQLMTAYEEACGPMTALGNVSTTSWDWVKTPAPWEYPHD